MKMGKFFYKTRTSRPEVLCEKGVFNKFAKCPGKHLCGALGLQLY